MKRLLSPVLLLAWAAAAAEQAPLSTSMSLGLQQREVVVSNPNAGYTSRGTSASASLSRRIGPYTQGSLSLSYGEDRARDPSRPMSSELAVGAFTAGLSHYLGEGRVLQGSVGYGRAEMSNATAGVLYLNNAQTLAAGIGIVQMIAIGANVSGTLGLSYMHTQSDVESYVNSSGTRVDGRRINADALALSGGVQWRLGHWTPSVNVSLSQSSKDRSLSDSGRRAIGYGLGLGYALDKHTTLQVSYGATAGLKNVKDSSLGIGIAFHF